MPRQLPWLNRGATTKTQVKTTQLVQKPRVENNSDDNFFAGTILAPPRKGKERADPPLDPDDELPGPLVQLPHKRVECADRTPSSSPPPIDSDLPPPKIEYMHKAVNKFNLRDDEWMMVEDEFLHTAKLFTRHLHLAEYERLKQNILEKKQIADLTVQNDEPSVECQIHQKKESLTKEQKKALRDVLFSGGSGVLISPKRTVTAESSSPTALERSRSDPSPTRSKAHPSLLELASKDLQSTKTPIPNSGATSNNSDLDTLKLPSKSLTHSSPFATPSLSARYQTNPKRPIRKSPFDYLDEVSSPNKSSQPSTSTSISKPSRAPSARSGISQAQQTSFDFFDDFDAPRIEPLRKEQANRLTKRKAEKDKERDKEKRKSVKLDDIPTFLF
ncbi:hypothetical protein CC78DRAFT_531200 [Lojkania enalia]|uniref:Uncharacterized protein n=1 Tax=Lojkania enalia TaxID=147567 RepID=A0A9P4KIL7_9PLEO|nr:hypothetical protein CC78DRAFT_531200 [Didymosphaeria enalia]